MPELGKTGESVLMLIIFAFAIGALILSIFSFSKCAKCEKFEGFGMGEGCFAADSCANGECCNTAYPTKSGMPGTCCGHCKDPCDSFPKGSPGKCNCSDPPPSGGGGGGGGSNLKCGCNDNVGGGCSCVAAGRSCQVAFEEDCYDPGAAATACNNCAKCKWDPYGQGCGPA